MRVLSKILQACASRTVVLAGAIEQRRIVMGARRGERLAARAEIHILLMIVGEVLAREGAVLAR